MANPACLAAFSMCMCALALGCGGDSEVRCDPQNNGTLMVQLAGGNVVYPAFTADYLSAELKPWTLRSAGDADSAWWIRLYASGYGSGSDISSVSFSLVGPPVAGQTYSLSHLDYTTVNGENLLSPDQRIGNGDARFNESADVDRNWRTDPCLGSAGACSYPSMGSLTIDSSTRAKGGYRDVRVTVQTTLAPVGTTAQGEITLAVTGTFNGVCEVPCDSISCN